MSFLCKEHLDCLICFCPVPIINEPNTNCKNMNDFLVLCLPCVSEHLFALAASAVLTKITSKATLPVAVNSVHRSLKVLRFFPPIPKPSTSPRYPSIDRPSLQLHWSSQVRRAPHPLSGLRLAFGCHRLEKIRFKNVHALKISIMNDAEGSSGGGFWPVGWHANLLRRKRSCPRVHISVL